MGRSHSIWAVAALLVVGVCAVPLFATGFLLFQFELVMLYMAAGMGLNVAVGYSGEFLLCQATVLGVGSYTAGVLTYDYHWSLWATLPASVVGAVLWQLVISLAGLRVRGLYLGLLTFFSVLVFPDLILLTSRYSQGSLGIIGLPPMVNSATPHASSVQYEITVAIGVVVLAFVYLLVRSGWGLRMRYLRDAPSALSTTGVGVGSTKATVYVLSAIPAGLAGWAYAYVNRSITSSVFDLSLTLVIFAGVEIVGPGTVWGPVVGVGILEGYSQLIGPFSQYNVIGLGLLLAVSLLVFPDGLVRGIRPVLARLPGRVGDSVRNRIEVLPEHQSMSDTNELRRSEPVPASTLDLPPSLVVGGLCKSFGGVHAVSDVSFTASPGRVMAIMGENGSGKTTLVNLISGFQRADAGEVSIGGREIVGLRPARIARLGVSRTFQVPQLVDELTVAQNVEVGLLRRYCGSPMTVIFRPRWVNRTNIARRRRALEVCAEVGFTPSEAETRVEVLPLGLRRLVEVARAASSGAEVVFLDEPAAGLNEAELANLSGSIRAFARSGRTILVVEHNAKFVLDTCDDVLLMRAGTVQTVFRNIDPSDLPDELRRHLRRSRTGAAQ